MATRATPGSGPLIPEDVQRDIVQSIEVKSAALQLMPHVRMKRAQQRIPVMSQLPTAYWITGASLDARDIGMKQTTSLQWDNVYLNAEEMAVIVPIAKNLLDDMDYDFWSQVKPKVTEAFGVALDDAVFFGTNAPTTFPPAIVTGANSAGNLVVVSSAVDYLDDINNAMATVEADGFDVTGFWARRQVKAKLRGLRDAQKGLLFLGDNATPNASINTGSLFGEPIIFSNAGLTSFNTGASGYSMIGGQWDQSMLAIRDDISMEMFDTGVITDNGSPPVIQYNLMQQDMVALRVTARFAWAIPNPVNRQQSTKASRYPFFALQQKAATGGEG
ncbi:MAG TPA: phage major capsid protein [Chloroflexota bacterium]|nr:phage major capsid protein [Chloroflexota bacterium]